MKLKIAYFGTPDFSAHLLEKILTDKELPVEVKFVVTQPDKRVGKKQILTPSPVKVTAQKYGIDTHDNIENWKLEIGNCDLGLLFALGSIIPAKILSLPKFGFWNIHHSLLPYYRGPSPTAYSLILGDKITGITIFKMDEKIDHGAILAQEKLEILKSDKRPDLNLKLTNLAFEMLKRIVQSCVRTGQCPVPTTIQDDSKATYTRRFKKQDGFVHLTTLKKALNNELLSPEDLPSVLKEYFEKNSSRLRSNNNTQYSSSESEGPSDESRSFQNLNLKLPSSSKIIFDYFRGLFPWPGIWTSVKINGNEKRLKILDMELIPMSKEKNVGANFNSPLAERLIIKRVQLEGKNPVDFVTFNKAYQVF